MSRLDEGRPLIRILRKWQTIAALVLILGLAGIGVAISSSTGDRPVVSTKKFNLTDALLASYSRATESTAKISYTQSGPATVKGTGVYDFTKNKGQMYFTSQVNGQSVKSTLIFDGKVEYDSMPQLPGKYLRVPLDAGNSFSLPSPFAFLESASAKNILRLLSTNGVTVQDATFAGALATEYVGNLNLSQLPTAGPLPLPNQSLVIRLWVDNKGAARQIQTVFRFPSSSSAQTPGPQISTIAFSNFGILIHVSPPSSNEVVDQLPKYSGPPPQIPPTAP